MEELKNAILELINEGKTITMKWNCGGDDGVISAQVDGKEMDEKDNLTSKLYMYVLNYLDIPCVGEFELDGGGKLIEENGNIYIEYETILKGYVGEVKSGDYDWIDKNEKVDDYSGKKELFIE